MVIFSFNFKIKKKFSFKMYIYLNVSQTVQKQLNFVNWELCQHVSAHITVFHQGRYLWHGAARPLTIFCLTTRGVHGTLWGPISTKNSLDWFYKQSQDNGMSCTYILSKLIVNLTTVNPL